MGIKWGGRDARESALLWEAEGPDCSGRAEGRGKEREREPGSRRARDRKGPSLCPASILQIFILRLRFF